MIVQHVSESDISGGAARAAYRIHRAMLEQSFDSRMLVQRKLSDDPTVQGPKGKLRSVLAVARHTVGKMILGLQRRPAEVTRCAAWLPSGRDRVINRSGVDVVNLHWICGEMLTVAEIGRINKPLVWTLHDMWAFCGYR